MKVKSWYNLGLRLDIEDEDLQTIKHDNPQDQEGCKRDLVRAWLRSCPQASYRQLLQALVELGDVREADRLCKKYGELCNKINSLTYLPTWFHASYVTMVVYAGYVALSQASYVAMVTCFLSHNFQGLICHSQDYNSSPLLFPKKHIFLVKVMYLSPSHYLFLFHVNDRVTI